MSYGFSVDDIDFYVEIKDQFNNEIYYADVEYCDSLISIKIPIPQVKDALFNALLERHPEMRPEIEQIINEINLKNNLVKP